MRSASFSPKAPPAADAVLTGSGPLMGFFERVAAGTSAECLAVLPAGGRTLIAPAAARPLFQLITSRGVDVKVLYPAAARLDPGIVGYARWVTGLGVSVRTAAAPPPTMMVFDRRLALLPLVQEDRTRGAAQVTDSTVVSTLTWLFQQAWRGAEPLGEDGAEPEPDGAALSDTERRLLRLLAQGGTDESAARQLALSVRSERRLVAGLMARLGAASRFQAGHEATRRGWL
ncbi:helix-turn-helix transcriptional regulator [Actinospica durhamensis]|uniref:Helix-turn-helix transcriptional regulator n=1 Tax=Actinospica durhamensis TaxID=1508375 RepID=A0A941EUQ3_9ACTN|nr:helix-turn-helix transcriptional regulator [Actinospica durhamensis]MBR7838670.1 helix-turn-helix transcriptional regulator [Actinospica durhamensis]